MGDRREWTAPDGRRHVSVRGDMDSLDRAVRTFNEACPMPPSDTPAVQKPKTLPDGWAWFDDGHFLIAVPPDQRPVLDRFVWHVSQSHKPNAEEMIGFTALVRKLDDHDALVRLARRVFK